MDAGSLDLKPLELAAEVIVDPAGSGGVEVVWRDVETGAHAGHAILQIRGSEVWWQQLEIAEPWRGKRTLAHICSTLTKAFRAEGCDTYVIHDLDMTPANDGIYTSLGFERDGSRLVASIATQGKLYRTAKGKL